MLARLCIEKFPKNREVCLYMGYLATGEIFENMLQLKRFGL